VRSPGHDKKTATCDEAAMWKFYSFAKLEYSSAIVNPKSTLTRSSDAWQGSSCASNSFLGKAE